MMLCSCGGRIITSVTYRDGERAHCGRCHRCISIAWLLGEVDALDEANARAEKKIERLYARGKDIMTAFHSERRAFVRLAELSQAVIADQDAVIAELESKWKS